MSCLTFIKSNSMIHKLDPRVKLVIAFVFSIFIAISQSFSVLWVCLILAASLALIARLPLKAVFKRLLGLNFFMLLLWLILPITTSGTTVRAIGPFEVTHEGILLAAAITLRGNAIVVIYTALLGTIEIVSLGHALSHLHVPAKLAHLFLFTVRYIDVLHHEYHRLRTAMKTRCFHSRANMHTYRTFAYLVGMLLTRSLDRSERVIAAMKCRGFSGRFYLINHFAIMWRDVMFIMLSTLLFVALLWIELL